MEVVEDGSVELEKELAYAVQKRPVRSTAEIAAMAAIAISIAVAVVYRRDNQRVAALSQAAASLFGVSAPMVASEEEQRHMDEMAQLVKVEDSDYGGASEVEAGPSGFRRGPVMVMAQEA